MAQQTAEPLDEIVWRSPALFHQFFGGALTPNTALLYFRESPFFDRLSNNSSLWTQAQFNPSLASLLHSREALEARLKTMTGLEFVVAMQAPEAAFYAIRKQFRKGRRLPKYDLGERPDGPDGKIEDVRVEGVYYIVAANIYPAPRVGAVLASRQLAIITHLRNALRKASALSNFTPSIGHHYISPTISTTTSTSSQSILPASSAPTQPSSQIQTPSQQSIQPSSSQLSTTTTAITRSLPPHHELAELRTMHQSLQLSLKHGNEFMDSSPPVPPGKSSQTSTAAAVVGGSYSSQGKKDSVPPSVAGDNGGGQPKGAPAAGGGGPMAGGGKPVTGASVGAGGAAAGAQAGQGSPGVKKRRKSKAAGVGGGVSPT
ncbi:MED6 mediator sub complex component-domain-containing protein [Kalaharituber pfeilii]|nr:MED6 mediator sub complex component-domain-containing protein [Kalaharituber pfeilii]